MMRMEVSGEGVDEYEIDGIRVSGDHRVQSPDGVWNLVRDDSRARPCLSSASSGANLIYCLTTTTRRIPLRGQSGALLLFRDWEEFEEEDEEGHRLWREAVLRLLNPGEQTPSSQENITPLMDPTTRVRVPGGLRVLSELRVGDSVMTQAGRIQRVLGIVEGEASQEEGYYWNRTQQRWLPWKGAQLPSLRGLNLVTETGEWSASKGTFRDFTEVGYQVLPNLYPLVAERLSGSVAVSLLLPSTPLSTQ